MLINNSKPDNSKQYLNIGELQLDSRYSKLAYVQDVTDGISKMQQGFFTFILKDCKGDSISARLFNVNNFFEVGQKARMLKGRLVKVEFYVQEFNGSLSLVLCSIDISDDEFNHKDFIGCIDNFDTICENIKHLENSDVIANASLTKFMGGKVGGFALFCNIVLEEVKLHSKFGLCDSTKLLDATDKLLPLLFKYYRLVEANPVIDAGTIIANSNAIMVMSVLEDNSAIISDAYLSCCGLTKPQYQEGKIIYNIVRNTLEMLDITTLLKSMSRGATKELSNGEVLKKL